MKASRLVVGSVVLALLSAACSGDQGATGPAGADGNANVVMYEFGSRTFTGATNYSFQATRGQIDSSLVLVYYNPSSEPETSWYPIPGAGPGAVFETRYFVALEAAPSTYRVGVRLFAPGGAAYPTEVTFTKVKVYLVPPSAVTSLNLGQPGVDLDDYEAMVKYLDVQR